jgi:RHH-type proline utilization regulon transcriptional repressor/proline dehydrogenase/delta 1-pyrroline-5-carboxylate dehydrogenase
MAQALRKVRGNKGAIWPLIVGGRPVSTPRTLVSTNPADPDEIVGVTGCADPEHGAAAIEAGLAAWPAWAARPVSERAYLVRALADRLYGARFELAATMVLEVGKSWREADADVAEAIDFCRYYADEAERLQGQPVRLGRYPGERNELYHRPLGLGAVIGPWNFPLAIVAGMTIGAVVTGNCVIVKPAEQAPIVAAKLVYLMHEAGFPPGVVQFVPGIGEELGAWLVTHPQTRFIAFTGSRAVGLSILREANVVRVGQMGPKRVICEMGGKNAIIVDDDADIDEAVAGVLHSAFGFQGQKCSACSRAIVVGTAWDTFVPRLVEAARSLEMGSAEDPRAAFGPVVDAEAAAKVRAYIELGRSEGRELLLREPPAGPCWAPMAIFEGIEPQHRLAQEEIFGPVLALMRAKDFDEALRFANSTEYALTGAIYSRSPTHLDRARRELEVGNLYINRGCTGALVYRQPFGGYRFSGAGAKAGGPGYLHQFVQERSISENTMRRGFAPDAP